jgi:TRAP-type C4-dicarboxylate transport system permease small subunit
MSGKVDRFAQGVLVLLGLMLLAMVALSVWNVMSRYLFSASLLWADEIAVFGMIAMGWLGAIVVAWRRMDIRMSVVSEMLPAGMQRWVMIVQHLTTGLLCGWVAWLSWGYVARLLKFGMTSDGARIPLWTVHICITISLAVLSAVALVRLVQALHTFRLAPGQDGARGAKPEVVK